MKKIFENMDEASRRFYSRVFNTALLNLYAVRRGYFDKLLCDTDDVQVFRKWNQELPEIVQRFRKDNLGR